MKFRVATLNDIDAIQALRIEMLKEVAEYLPGDLPNAIHEYLNAHMKDGSCLCALMENEEGIVGKAMPCIYTVMPDEINMSGKCAALFSVYTLPKYRGRGYMKELLDYLLEKAKEAGVSEVFASAEKKAIPLYQRIGFTFQENEMSIRL